MNEMNHDAMTEELLDLLTERALGELSADDEERLRELLETAGLLERSGLRDADDIDLAAAAAMNAFAGGDGSSDDAPVPERLTARLHADADRFFASERPSPVSDIEAARERRAREKNESAPAAKPRSARAGWMVAAMLAVVVVAFGLRSAGPGATDPSAARAALLAETGTSIIEWNRSDIPGFNGVSGDVVWNDARQEGYLRLTGMPANDPAIAQYQLWIVDPDRDANPVDGGVFDVPHGSGEVVIPIDAKLDVSNPDAFAITREQPGGVVVSDGPLLLVAPTADPAASAS